MNPFTKPTPSSLPPNPISTYSKTPPAGNDEPLTLPTLEAHARLIQANFDAVSQLSDFAKKTTFVEIATRLKELSLKEVKIAEIDGKEKRISEIAQKVIAEQKQLADDRSTFQEECVKLRQKIQDERLSRLQKDIQYALPKFLTAEEARPFLVKLQPALDAGSEGKQLQIFFGLAAVAEDTKDSQLYITALIKLFPLLRDIDSKLSGTGGGFINDFTSLINKGNDFGFEVRAPKKGDPVVDWMNSPVGVRVVSEVFSWAISNKEKAVVRKAEVK